MPTSPELGRLMIRNGPKKPQSLLALSSSCVKWNQQLLRACDGVPGPRHAGSHFTLPVPQETGSSVPHIVPEETGIQGCSGLGEPVAACSSV